MDYLFLTPNDFAGLRRERITQLEAEHYRVSLMVDEAATEEELTQIAARREEIARRILVHRDALATEMEASVEEQPAEAATEGT